jgi:hypothetical protein
MQSKKYDKLVDDVEMLKQQRIASPWNLRTSCG